MAKKTPNPQMTKVSNRSFNVAELVGLRDEYENREFNITRVNPNSLKERQTMYAPTTREKFIQKRRQGFRLKKKTEVMYTIWATI